MLSKKTSSEDYLSFWFIYGTLCIFLIIMGAVGALMFNSAKQVLYKSGRISRVNHGFIKLDTQSSRFILRSSFPALERSAGEEDPNRLFELDWAAIYWRLAANIRHTNSREILKTQFPLLALVKIAPTTPMSLSKTPSAPPVKVKSLEPPAPPRLAIVPEVLIYHTHTSECYIPASGKEHALNKKGDIVKVGERLQQILEEEYHIKTIHCETIHDRPPFKESYDRSQITVKNYLQKYPSLKILIDLHRDATPGINAVCKVKQESTATILIVVGSDKMLPHPHWKKNHAFALKVADLMNLYYPGLNSGVLVSKGRFNQHLHDHALIFEFGDHNSTMAELYNSVKRFAEVLAIALKEEFPPPKEE